MSTLNRATLPTVENRRARLRKWIDEQCDGSQAQFIASTADGDKQLNQGELSGLLRSKSFGEKKARSLEVQAGMPPGYLDATETAVAVTGYGVGEPEAISLSVVVPAKRMVWPFHTVTQRRLRDLRAALGPKTGAEAMRDIDSLLDAAVSKWEKVASSKKKSG